MHRKHGLSLVTRLTILFATAILIILAVVAFIGSRALQDSSDRVFSERLQTTRLYAAYVDGKLAQTLDNLARTVPLLLNPNSLDEPSIRPSLARFISGNPELQWVFITDSNGVVKLVEPGNAPWVGLDFSSVPAVRNAINSGTQQTSNLTTDKNLAFAALMLVTPLTDQRGVTTATVGAIAKPSSANLSNLLLPSGSANLGDRVYLVDGLGNLIARNDGEPAGGKAEPDQMSLILQKDGKASVESRVRQNSRGQGFAVISAFAPLETTPWTVVVEQNEEQAFAGTGNLQRWVVAVAVFSMLVMSVAVLLAARSIILPLRALLQASRRIGSGDLNTPITAAGGYEITQLGEGMEGMRQRLEEWSEHLETAVQKRTRALSILYSIDRASAHSLELDQILRNALTRISQLLHVDCAAVFILDDDHQTLNLRLQRGMPEDFASSIRAISAKEALAAQALETGALSVYHIADFSRGRMSAFLIRDGLGTLITVPLMSGGISVGVLSAAFHARRTLPQEETDLWTSIGRQLGAAVQNSRLFMQTQADLERMTDLYQLSAEVLSKSTLKDTARLLASRVNRAFHAYATVIAVRGAEEKVKYLSSVDATGEIQPPAFLDVLAARIMRTGETLVDYGDGDLVVLQDVELGIESLVGLPLRIGPRITGAMIVEYSERRSFEADEIQALGIYANQAATALERARLDEETGNRAERLAVLNRIASVAGATLQIDELLQAAFTQVTATVHADAFFIALYDPSANELDFRIQVDQGTTSPPERRPLTSGLTSSVILSKRMVAINNMEKEAEKHPSPNMWGSMKMPQSWVGTPLMIGTKVVGVMSLQAYAPDAFRSEELDLLATIADQLAVAIENARLYEAEQDRATQLARVLELSTAMAKAQNQTALVQEIVKQAREIAGSTTCTLLLVDWDENRAVLQAQSGLPEGTGAGTEFQLSLPIVRNALESCEPILLPDIDRQAPEIRRILVRQDLRSFFAYPMVHEGRSLGFITLSYLTPYSPSPDEITTFCLLAERAAAAIENVRLGAETRSQLAQLTALFEISAELRGLADVQSMLDTLLARAMDVMTADTASLSIVEGDRLVCRAGMGPRQELVGSSVAVGEGITGRVAVSGEPHISSDYATDDEDVVPVAQAWSVARIVSDICVPLKTSEEVIGVMHVSSFTPRTYPHSQVQLLLAMSNIAASAIHRANLFDQLEDRVNELGTVYEVGKAVTSSLHLSQVLSMVTDIAPRALGAEGCFLYLWDEAEQCLVLRAGTGFGASAIGEARQRPTEGLAGWVFVENKVANIPNLERDDRWKGEPELGWDLPSGRPCTALVLPLRVSERTLGVIGVLNKTGAPAFTAGDVSLLTALGAQIAVAIDNARLYEDVRDFSLATIRSLATAIDARDPYTRGHSEGVSELAVRVAEAMGWSRRDQEQIEYAALLHDVGKIAVPDAILRNTGALTQQEWEVIQMHPYHSAQIVQPVKSLRGIVPWVYHHQERWDGSGYPDGLRGEQIPLASRIIAVVDAYNAMTTDRPYRKALTHKLALEELRRYSGVQFDPAIVAKFEQVLATQST